MAIEYSVKHREGAAEIKAIHAEVENVKRWKTVSIRIPPEVHAEIESFCKQFGFSVRDWIRFAIVRELLEYRRKMAKEE